MQGAERRERPRVQAACVHAGWGGWESERPHSHDGAADMGALRGEHRLLVDTRGRGIWGLPPDAYAARVPAD